MQIISLSSYPPNHENIHKTLVVLQAQDINFRYAPISLKLMTLVKDFFLGGGGGGLGGGLKLLVKSPHFM